ncbi:MAG: hypothetical protein GYB67_11590 [Chloroflexi bacterium]|nr:hypothetical protein [Chloroflexota bacterium]
MISRHRLPPPYRYALTALWCTPALLLVAAIVISRGINPALLDVRLLLPLGALLLPAVYVWREGVDVLPDGLIARVHVPRYLAYRRLASWHYDPRRERRTLVIWDTKQHTVLECRAGHLTDLPTLLAALDEHLPERPWPR